VGDKAENSPSTKTARRIKVQQGWPLTSAGLICRYYWQALGLLQAGRARIAIAAGA